MPPKVPSQIKPWLSDTILRTELCGKPFSSVMRSKMACGNILLVQHKNKTVISRKRFKCICKSNLVCYQIQKYKEFTIIAIGQQAKPGSRLRACLKFPCRKIYGQELIIPPYLYCSVRNKIVIYHSLTTHILSRLVIGMEQSNKI